MSLIHDAIRKMEKSSLPHSATLYSPDITRYPTQNAAKLWPGLLAFAVVLALGAVVWWLWSNTQSFGRANNVESQSVLPAPTATSPVPAVVGAQMAPAVATQVAPDGATALAPSATAPTVTAPVPAPVSAPAQAVATPDSRTAPPPNRQASVQARRAVATAAPDALPVAHALPLEQRYAVFLQAVNANDMPAAELQLKAIQAQVGPANLARLRAEAWYATRSGDSVVARSSYQDILEHLPGDEWASINLASLEAAANKRESARQILVDALRSNPESEALLAAIAQFKNSGMN